MKIRVNGYDKLPVKYGFYLVFAKKEKLDKFAKKKLISLMELPAVSKTKFRECACQCVHRPFEVRQIEYPLLNNQVLSTNKNGFKCL